MAYERSLFVDWDAAERLGQWVAGPWYRYDPNTGDIDGMPTRYGGDPEFRQVLHGCSVSFRDLDHID